MTRINFDEPSDGAVNDNNKVALNVRARGEGSHALWGETEHDKGGAGVVGISKVWVGVHGISTGKGHGVFGESKHGTEGGAGVLGQSTAWVGVHGISTGKGHGVIGETTGEHAPGGAGVIGKSKNWIGVLGQGPTAGRFEGNVQVTGDITLEGGGDCAEEFDVSCVDKVEPGTVMVLSSTEGELEPGSRAYDKRVAGVASGASGFRPGIVLDKKQQEFNENKRRMPIALMGKVYCKVDASYSPIELGDLLTTSPTVGHAMKANDSIKAFGTVIGKALKPLREGKGLIPVLIALQ